MIKIIEFNLWKSIYERAKKPLRTKRDLILLVLHVIRMMESDLVKSEPSNGMVYIVIHKMNRMFFLLPEKMFSIQFPFGMETDNKKVKRFFDYETGMMLDSLLLSKLILLFEFLDRSQTFDEFFDEIMSAGETGECCNSDAIWNLVKRLLSYDAGYLRYDYDEEHEKGNFHPVNHLDINYENAATFKIGVHERLDRERFQNLLDVTTECEFLS